MPDITVLHDFADSTQSNCFITSLALFIIVIVMVAPTRIGRIGGGLAKLVGILLLGYVLFSNSNILLNLFRDNPTILSDSEFGANAILSCVFSIALVGIILYILLTFVL